MTDTKTSTIRFHPADNVVVARSDLDLGSQVLVEGFDCRDRIPAGHKVATEDIPADSPVCKYGEVIGFASGPIARGEHIHTHNIHMRDFNREPSISIAKRPTQYLPESKRAVFRGILRADGRVGTRNYIGILPTVSCSAGVARLIADKVSKEDLKAFPNVDGVISLVHGQGCGMGLGGEDFTVLQRTMSGFSRHPNFAGVLLLGLGCEVNQIGDLLKNNDLREGPLLQTLNIQDAGGTSKTVERGITIVREMMPKANSVVRCPVPANYLTVGLECGGSDAFSGISANPALGVAADLVVRHGGTVILSETPEIYGAEHLLTRRATNRQVGKKLLERIRWWEGYTAKFDSEINNNPSPGNKAGGLSTILEKSLGAVVKGGSTNLEAIYSYAEPVTTGGLVFMDTPGYDVVSITGMVAGGANVICFTTGRGTVCGGKPCPSIKIASNTRVFNRMHDDMDFNCGTIVDGDATIEYMGRILFDLILKTASGEKTKSELWGLGDTEFIPWQLGAVM